ncbi:hypothetical protein PYW07_016571 [Mythimna separata]|uniref:Uncharacterized protein n=1 Tax=Mythimna separata TaxID=271217 RepID=A0AAD8DSV6_MYTSE|nr:hypothetical protein PYW07_016571 [Mythimna separata]
MLLPGDNSPKTWLLVTILVSTIIAFSESSGGKTHSHEYNPRAMDGESSNEESGGDDKKIALKPSSEENPVKKEESKERVKPEKSEDEDDDDDKNSGSGNDNTVRVTRGPKNGDFEPEEENPKVHAKYDKISESEHNSEEDGRRYKRHIARFGNVEKRK